MPSDATTHTDSYLRILAECVPELTIRTCELAGEGFDSVALLVNGELIIRIAKRPDVALRLANEARLLPALPACCTAPPCSTSSRASRTSATTPRTSSGISTPGGARARSRGCTCSTSATA
jgi:hypothetical protein